mgnify:CR=1 FL=1
MCIIGLFKPNLNKLILVFAVLSLNSAISFANEPVKEAYASEEEKEIEKVKQRVLNDKAYVYTIPQIKFGEEIKPNSVILTSQLLNETILDDGFGNLASNYNSYIFKTIDIQNSLFIFEDPDGTELTAELVSYEEGPAIDIENAIFQIKLQDILTNGFTKREKSKTLLERRSFCYTDEFSDNAQRFLKTREKFGVIVINLDNGLLRTVNQIEMERLQGFPDGYTSILSKAHAGSLLGDGWTLPIIEHIFSFIK